MNLPNQISLFRMLLIPIIILVLYLPIQHSRLIAAAIFLAASATDWLDGYLARKYKLVTSIGKFLDPLADKMMVCAVLVMLVEFALIPAWMAIVIIGREFMVSGLRTAAAEKKRMFGADSLAKAKTVSQMAAVVLILLGVPYAIYVMWLAVVLTVLSGINYLIQAKDVLAG